MRRVIVPEWHDVGAAQSGAGMHGGVCEFVDQDQVAGPGERRDDPGIGEIARAEDAGCVRALQPREPRLQLGIKRMAAGDEPRGAGARAVAFRRRGCRALHRGMLAEIEIIVAAEGQECAAVADDMHAVARVGLDDAAAQVATLALGELVAGEKVEGPHGYLFNVRPHHSAASGNVIRLGSIPCL